MCRSWPVGPDWKGYLVLLCVWFAEAEAQTLHYRAQRSGEKVGYMKVEKSCQGERCTYTLDYKLSLNLIWTVGLSGTYRSEFVNGVLHAGEVAIRRDGAVKEQYQLSKTKEGYVWYKENVGKKLAISPVAYSSVMMYHQEPKGRTFFYSERYGRHLSVGRSDSDTYQVDLPGLLSHAYTYENGYCVELQTQHTFGSVTFVLESIR